MEAMEEKGPDYRTPVYVWLVLLALTLVAVVLSQWAPSAFGAGAALLIATAKTALVAYFFMRVRFERGVLRLFLPIAALIIIVLVSLVFTDVLYRQAMIPGAASDIGMEMDTALRTVGGAAAALFLIVTAVMLYLLWRYRRGRNPEPGDLEESLLLESAWIIMPAIIVLAIFYTGLKGYVFYKDSPDAYITVKVTAQMWSWSFEYENGMMSDTLVLPAGKAVRLRLASNDVLHSLFIPQMRLKADAVPGMTRTISFTPLREGAYDIFCAEFCGTMHSNMLSKAEVLSQEGFDSWYIRHPQ